MRFKLDENLPAAAQIFLREQLHDADTVLDEELGGHSDNEVYRAAILEQRILVTLVWISLISEPILLLSILAFGC